MNAPYDIERDLTRWMAAVVPTRAPDNLAPSIVTRTRSMRPNPTWLARLKEPPMQTQLSLRNYLGFGRSLRPILVAVLILALVAGGIIVGSRLLRQQSLPPPFGVAGNGLLAADLIDGTVVVMRPDGSAAQQLELPFDGVGRMAFSRDGTRFAAWWTPDPAVSAQKGLLVANADGSGAFVLGTSRHVLSEITRIDWSPDDRRLAFSDGADRLFVADIAAGSVRELAPDAGISRRRDPTWSPDGRLAYRCTADAVLHLCVMDATLHAERILATSPGTDWAFQHSSWSHDGKLIAYYVDDAIDHPAATFGFDVATIDPETGEERILTRGTAEHTIMPVWTPDNRHILVAGGIVAADGSGLRLIGNGACDWTEPSPDGRFATCLVNGPSPHVELWPVDGGDPITLALPGQAKFVAWQRVSN